MKEYISPEVEFDLFIIGNSAITTSLEVPDIEIEFGDGDF